MILLSGEFFNIEIESFFTKNVKEYDIFSLMRGGKGENQAVVGQKNCRTDTLNSSRPRSGSDAEYFLKNKNVARGIVNNVQVHATHKKYYFLFQERKRMVTVSPLEISSHSSGTTIKQFARASPPIM